jgi:hypothetical protein
VKVKLVSVHELGVVVESRWRRRWAIAYGEILTAERLRSGRALRLHTRVMEQPLDVVCRRSTVANTEVELRRRGVRIVDCWGAIIAPTLLDFEEELAREPVHLRQSSDNA